MKTERPGEVLSRKSKEEQRCKMQRSRRNECRHEKRVEHGTNEHPFKRSGQKTNSPCV
jgi:hypothetical protein